MNYTDNNYIGSIHRKALELFRQHGLTLFRNILEPLDFIGTAKETINKPMRQRVLIPEVIIWLMMLVSLECTSMANALSKFWESIRLNFADMPLKAVSPAAFCKARSKLPIEFFSRLFNILRGRFLERFSSMLKWKGWRVYAVDGTTEDLPPSAEILKEFGGPSNQKGQSKKAQARLVAVISVFCGFCLDFVIVPYSSGEQAALYKLLLNRKLGDLLLLDRGFFSYAAIWKMVEGNIAFVMRAPNNLHFKVIRWIGVNEAIVEFRPSRSVRRNWPELPEIFQVRWIKYQIPGFRPSYLLTSIMDESIATAEEIVALYHRRWQVETVYRELKHVIDIQNIRSQTKEGVEKENYTQLMLNNLVRWLMAEAAEEEGCYGVDLSFLEAVRALRDALPQMAIGPPLKLIRIYRDTIKRIRAAKILKRPGRYYPRHGDGKAKNKGGGYYAQPDRLAV